MSYVRPDALQRARLRSLMSACILLLILVMVLGAVGGGARSWLDLGLIRIQPSELMKPVLVIVLARFYAGVPPREIRRWSAIWPAVLLVGFPTLLILLQPDLGTAMLIACCDDRDDVPRRPAACGCSSAACSRSPRRCRSIYLLPADAAPAGARADLPQSGAGSARRRLSSHPVEDRDRLGRAVRQGLPARHPGERRLPARAAYRFHLRRDRRGMGAGRRPVPDPALRPAAALGHGRRARREEPLRAAGRGRA